MDVGEQLGPYRIDEFIAEGGMGRVYRGFDTRLTRNVAIKTSREEFSDRFAREARTIAQLNHPHICTLYDVGPSFLVMEFVEGQTLATLLKDGPLPIEMILKYGAQIADALAAAHAKNIVHRDLKPQNVMVTRGGVKVLDFGLAKMTSSCEETLTTTRAVMGTPAYMAPEQRQGKAADARTDIFALGLILREMVSGKAGESAPVRPATGLMRQLAPIIDRCLAPDPEDRWQSARDLTAAFEIVRANVGEPEGEEKLRTRFLRSWVVIGALSVVFAVMAGYLLRPAVPERTTEFSILPPEGTSFLPVDQSGPPALSPDGSRIAFVASGPGGRNLWVRSLDKFDARPLPGTEEANYPFWSPDGQWLGFFAGGLKKVSVLGGQPQVLADFGAAGGAWSRDGTILFIRGATNLYAVSEAASEPRKIADRNVERLEENQFLPHLLPDQRHYLLLIRGGAELEYQVWLGEIGSNARELLLNRATNAQYALPRAGTPGHILFVRDNRLMAQPFDEDSLKLSGTPVILVDGLATSAAGGIGDFSVSSNGVLAYRTEEPVKQELVWYSSEGELAGSIGNHPGNPRNSLRLSPDGKSVAFTRQGEETQDVWIYDLDRSVDSRFSFGGGRSPLWSPDGSQIAFLRENTIYLKPVGQAGPEQVLFTGPGILALNDWSRDGQYLLFTRWDEKSGRGLWLLGNPLSDVGNREPQLLESPALHGQFQPTSGAPRWVAFDSEDDRKVRQVFVRTMPGEAQGRWQVSTAGGNGARWRRDGRELYFVSGGSMVAVSVDSGAFFRPDAPRVLFGIPRALAVAITQYAPGYDVDLNGNRFLSTYPGGDSAARSINIVINWQSKLRR